MTLATMLPHYWRHQRFLQGRRRQLLGAVSAPSRRQTAGESRGEVAVAAEERIDFVSFADFYRKRFLMVFAAPSTVEGTPALPLLHPRGDNLNKFCRSRKKKLK